MHDTNGFLVRANRPYIARAGFYFAELPGSVLLRNATFSLALIACSLLHGCANNAVRADQLARTHGYEKAALRGTGFEHIAYFKHGNGSSALHVYIEHDGTPWITPTTPTSDPTPSNPMMLRMMSVDPAPVLYIGRLCYFGTAGSPPCEAIWWTYRRFSREVIQSMDAALVAFLKAHPDSKRYTFSATAAVALWRR